MNHRAPPGIVWISSSLAIYNSFTSFAILSSLLPIFTSFGEDVTVLFGSNALGVMGIHSLTGEGRGTFPDHTQETFEPKFIVTILNWVFSTVNLSSLLTSFSPASLLCTQQGSI